MIDLLPLHQVLVYGTYVLPQLCQFWDMFQAKPADKNPYKASIGGMSLRLSKLQESNSEAPELKSKKQLADGWKDINRVLHHQGLSFVPKVIQVKLTS